MKPFGPFALAPLALAGGMMLPLSATAQELDPRLSLLDYFAPDRIATMLAHGSISALRTVMELEYQHLSVDPLRGSVSISGVTARPLLPYDRSGQCEITVDRVSVNTDYGQSLITAAELNLDLIGLRATLACIEPEVALMLRTAGYKTLPVDQISVQGKYLYNTGQTDLDATIAVNGVATWDVSGSGVLLPALDPVLGVQPGKLRVTRFVTSLKDDGGWAAAASVIPPNLTDPETIRAMGTQGLSEVLTDGGLRPLGAVERRFVDQLMDRVVDYVADPGEITIEAGLPDDGVVMDFTELEYPQGIVPILNLQARTAPLARTALLPVDLLAPSADRSPTERLALAQALLTGDGAPRTPPAAIAIARPLLDSPDTAGPAAALLARAVADDDPQAAYGYALIAAGSAMPDAVAQLDAVEALLPTGTVLALQEAHLTGAPAPASRITGDDPRDLRALSLSYFTGAGAARSYALAYYYALLAEAAGDVAAPTLIAEIDARFAARGPAVADDWRTRKAAISDRALQDWIDENLPARYARDR